MRAFSFENQGEMKAYDRGKQDALDELYAQIYEDLSTANAFPDTDPRAFAAWGSKFLMPRISRRRSGDDLFKKLMDLEPGG